MTFQYLKGQGYLVEGEFKDLSGKLEGLTYKIEDNPFKNIKVFATNCLDEIGLVVYMKCRSK
jgi:hypothetical protein